MFQHNNTASKKERDRLDALFARAAMDSNNGGNNMITLQEALAEEKAEEETNNQMIAKMIEGLDAMLEAPLAVPVRSQSRSKRASVAFDADAVALDQLTDQQRTEHARLMAVHDDLYREAKERDERHSKIGEALYRQRRKQMNKFGVRY